jgi:DNA-binding protein YbaB
MARPGIRHQTRGNRDGEEHDVDASQERLYEAREGIDRTLQRLETIEPRAEEVHGADERRVVRVRVAPDGRVRSITVDHRWQDVLAPEALGPAIASAYAAAGAERLEQWTSDVDAAMALPEPANRPFPTAVADHLASLPSGQPVTEDAVLRELAEVWAELEAELDRAIDGLTEKVERTHRASSPGGEVSVEVSSAGGLLALDLRPAWVERSHPANIGRTVLAVVEQAQAAALGDLATIEAEAARSTEALTRLGDPARLGRRLGLDG